MPWLELALTTRIDQQPAAEAALEALGALAITLQDANAQTPDEQAIFEPGVGELPLWQTITLQALFDADTDRLALLAALNGALEWLEPTHIELREVADQDWELAWMDQFQPMQFGRRLWIYPWNIEPPDDAVEVGRSSASCDAQGRASVAGGRTAGATARDTSASMHVVRLDPGLAFGSGTHPTTALCLEWLDGLDLTGKSITDYGCGSGILAIAALKLGAARAVGVDNDPQALLASADNAERNGVATRLQLQMPGDARLAPADIFVANILAGPLAELAPTFAAAAAPGAPFAISGILQGQQDELLARYAEWFDALRVDTREDWVRISGRRLG